MNFFSCQICETKAAVLKCRECTKTNVEECFFCYNCSKVKHEALENKGEEGHRIHKLSFKEMKMLMEKPYNAHSIVPLSSNGSKARSRLYVKGKNISTVKSEYQKVKENVRFMESK